MGKLYIFVDEYIQRNLDTINDPKHRGILNHFVREGQRLRDQQRELLAKQYNVNLGD